MERPGPEVVRQHEVPHPDVMLIEAQRSVLHGSAQLVHYHFLEPPDHRIVGTKTYRLDFSLDSRPTNPRGSYEQVWPASRFERVGNVFLLPPEQVLRGKSDASGRSSSLVLELEADAVHRWLDREVSWSAERLATTLDIQDRHVSRLLLRLVEEIRHPGFANETLVELLTTELSIELARRFARPGDLQRTRSLSPQKLKLIEERLRENPRAPTVSELADLCGISERQLTRGFKAARDCSIGAYVANYQVERAKAMLSGDLSIKAIAHTLGFSSTSSFCYAFRRATSLSPKKYRESVLPGRRSQAGPSSRGAGGS